MNTSTMKFSNPSRACSIGCAALASLVCLLANVPASADPVQTRSVTVNFRDLDVATNAGATTLYRRIQGAARLVCGYEGSDFIERRIWKDCYNQAIDHAVTKVNNPLLTAVHTGKAPGLTAMAK
jgi:UrcA family protein